MVTVLHLDCSVETRASSNLVRLITCIVCMYSILFLHFIRPIFGTYISRYIFRISTRLSIVGLHSTVVVHLFCKQKVMSSILIVGLYFASFFFVSIASLNAYITQLVECDPLKVAAAGSTPAMGICTFFCCGEEREGGNPPPFFLPFHLHINSLYIYAKTGNVFQQAKHITSVFCNWWEMPM